MSKKLLTRRLYGLRLPICYGLVISVIDICFFWGVGKFIEMSQVLPKYTLGYLSTLAISIVVMRTILIVVLKRMLTMAIFEKRNAEETQILRLVLCGKESSDGSKENGKEILMNTLNLCTINFDLPITALAGEVFFACGAVVLLAYYLDLNSVYWLSPMVISLLLVLKRTANRLKNFGQEVIQKTKEKIRWLDNTVSCSREISSLRNWEGAISLYNESARGLNNTVSTQIYLSSRIQTYSESFAIACIFGLVILWEIGLVSMEAAGVASALAVISRLLPTVTRSISSMTQLQYGIPAVYRLERFLKDL